MSNTENNTTITEKIRPLSHPSNTYPTNQENIKEHFHKLRQRLKIGLLIAFMAPLVILSIYFHIQFSYSLKESSKLHLAALAESQRNTIDLFLQERVVNIFSLFHSSEFSLSPSEQDLQKHLQNLRQISDAFIDVGFFNKKGLQIGYAGPFPYLHGKDYSRESWFATLISQDRDYYISDIYLGFRNRPHFTIAVKQLIDGKPYVMRATLDPDKFSLFLRTIGQGKGVDSVLINKEGYYQIVDPDKGELLGKSEYMPSVSAGTGVEEERVNGDSILVAYSWLTMTPWVLEVRQPSSIAYARMYRVRSIMIAVTVFIIVVIAGAIWFATDRLLKHAQSTAEAKEELHYQLIHASKLASVGELAAGVAHEINNPLAIISAQSGVIRDMQEKEFGLECSPEIIKNELDIIDQAVFRARRITQKLLNFARKDSPRLVPCNVNKVLDEVVAGFKENEFQLSNIKLVRDYDLDLPKLLLDHDQIGQVFLNLINNAEDAIDGSGTITLSTRHDDSSVYVMVADTGAGMSSDQMKKIFLPFFTTKEAGKGTGLGLPVSLSIVESMGGTIKVQSVPGAGSSFTVVLPISEHGEKENGAGNRKG